MTPNIAKHPKRGPIEAIVYYFCLIIGGFVATLCVYKGMSLDSPQFISAFILLINGYQVYYVRKNYNLLIIFGMILFFNYSIILPNYFFPIDSVFIIDPHLTWNVISLNVLFVFNYLLMFTIPKRLRSLETQLFWEKSKIWHSTTHFVLITTLLYVFIFEFKMPESTGGRGTGTPIYEYSVILMMFALSFSNKKNLMRTYIFLSLLFILQENIFGARLIALQYMICIYVLVFAEKYKLQKVFPLIILVFFVYNIIGSVRGGLLYGGYQADNIINVLKGNLFTQDTAYSAYYTSETAVRRCLEITTAERLALFGDFLKSIFIGESGEQHARVLASYASEFYKNWGGGVIPHHFYCFLGIPGLLIPIALLRYYFHIISSENFINKPLLKCIGFYITVSCPRWYLYSPLILIRAILFLIIAYIVFNTFNRITAGK